MESIDKPTAHLLTDLLRAYGVRRIVLSPGTRSAPLAVAMARSGYFDISVIIDERCAAFAALGMALRLGHPVAMVCTSGSAVLNYAPALAEAYYRRVPLIAISADRPVDLIDQRDSQTIRQPGALTAVTRASVDIADDRTDRYLRYANRLINQTLAGAVGPIPGPVHINMQFDTPLTKMVEGRAESHARKIGIERPKARYDFTSILASIPRTSKVLVVSGDMHPIYRFSTVLRSAADKLALVAEAQANLGVETGIKAVKPDFASLPAPDIVVSIGGSLVSARLKAYLRSLPHLRHISAGYDDVPVDTFFSLSEVVECPAEDFLKALAEHLEPSADFCEAWRDAVAGTEEGRSIPLIGLLQQLVDGLHIADFHFSNGSAIRYGQLLNFRDGQRIDCNRGVSGIDGCTSTAIGAAIVAQNPTVLVTGDMSAAYDVGAFAIPGIPPTFKMVVLDNGGGDIFRAIPSTGPLPECERLFAVAPKLPLRSLAEGYGFDYFEAEPGDDISEFINSRRAPAILRVKMCAGSSKSIL